MQRHRSTRLQRQPRRGMHERRRLARARVGWQRAAGVVTGRRRRVLLLQVCREVAGWRWRWEGQRRAWCAWEDEVISWGHAAARCCCPCPWRCCAGCGACACCTCVPARVRHHHVPSRVACCRCVARRRLLPHVHVRLRVPRVARACWRRWATGVSVCWWRRGACERVGVPHLTRRQQLRKSTGVPSVPCTLRQRCSSTRAGADAAWRHHATRRPQWCAVVAAGCRWRRAHGSRRAATGSSRRAKRPTSRPAATAGCRDRQWRRPASKRVPERRHHDLVLLRSGMAAVELLHGHRRPVRRKD